MLLGAMVRQLRYSLRQRRSGWIRALGKASAFGPVYLTDGTSPGP